MIRVARPQSFHVGAFPWRLPHAARGLRPVFPWRIGLGTWEPRLWTVSCAHGVANLVGGLWPLLHISSFEMVFGPKTDRWLVKTVAGLLMVNGLTQLTTSLTAGGVRQARRLGVGTAAVHASIDLVSVAARRITMYLVDAALEVGWILAWWRVDKPAQGE
jgi:hypothetical protein